MDSGIKPTIVQFHPSTVSTNTQVKERFTTGMDADTLVLFTFNQLKGRGTRGRSWHCQEGKDIALSIGHLINKEQQVDPRFSLAIGEYVSQLIEQSTECSLKTRWPNDLLGISSDRDTALKKCCGILIETTEVQPDKRLLIVGIGINVNSEPDDFPEEIKAYSTSLLQITGKSIDINNLALSMIEPLVGLIQNPTQEIVSDLTNLWIKRDTTRGLKYRLLSGHNEIFTAESVDPKSGGLILSDTNGNPIEINSYTELERLEE